MEEPNLKVCVLQCKSLSFTLFGDYLAEGYDETFNGEYLAWPQEGGIKLEHQGRSFMVQEGIKFSPENYETDSFIIKNVLIGQEFHWERREKQRFPGSLMLLVNDGIEAVNIIPMEDYLLGAISSEMNAAGNSELLKAHAIVSRSWTMSHLIGEKNEPGGDAIEETAEGYSKWYRRGAHQGFDFCADSHCQRFYGLSKSYTDVLRRAVKDTAGLVLTFGDTICDARFSKCCGGMTENYENVWDSQVHPYLSGVIDYKYGPDNLPSDLRSHKAAEAWIRNSPSAFCNTKDESILSQCLVDLDLETVDFFRWESRISQEELKEVLLEKTEMESKKNLGDIIEIVPLERGHSGRISKLRLIGTSGGLTVGKELEIRRLLSKSHLYSSAFIVEKAYKNSDVPSEFLFKGAGWGHGVGLCQIGAAMMGEMGYRFDEILRHYFKATKIKKIY